MTATQSEFREPNTTGAIYKTEPDGNPYCVTEWKHATKEEWDNASEHGRNILMGENNLIFVVKA